MGNKTSGTEEKRSQCKIEDPQFYQQLKSRLKERKHQIQAELNSNFRGVEVGNLAEDF